MSNERVAPGKYVNLTYSIVDDNGNVVEQHDLPIGFVFGSDTEMLGGMDKAVFGKRAGDTIEVELPPQDGFGEHDPNLTFTDELDNVPPEFRRIGAEVQMKNADGEAKTFFVSHLDDKKLTLDGNHPLAGKTLTVRVNIIEVRDAQPGEDKTSGIHASAGPGSTTIN